MGQAPGGAPVAARPAGAEGDGAHIGAAGDACAAVVSWGGGGEARRGERAARGEAVGAPPGSPPANFYAALAEVVGGNPARDGFQLSWLLPTPIVYPDAEQLTGFCFRDTPKPRNTEEMEALL